MKNLLLFSTLLLLLFSACQPDDFPAIDSPKLVIKSVTNINGEKVYDFTYEKGLVDSMIFYQSRSKFKVSYTDGHVTSMRQSFDWDPVDTLEYRDYSFEYTAQTIIVTTSLKLSAGTRRETTRTYYLNETGERVTEIGLYTLEFSQNTGETLIDDHLYQYTWDEEGKNILEMKIYASNIFAPMAARTLWATLKYTYDDNPNPYFGMMRPFFPNFDEAYFMSENNIKTQELIYQNNPSLNDVTDFEYIYEEKGFPEMSTRSSSNSQFTFLLTYK